MESAGDDCRAGGRRGCAAQLQHAAHKRQPSEWRSMFTASTFAAPLTPSSLSLPLPARAGRCILRAIWPLCRPLCGEERAGASSRLPISSRASQRFKMRAGIGLVAMSLWARFGGKGCSVAGRNLTLELAQKAAWRAHALVQKWAGSADSRFDAE